MDVQEAVRALSALAQETRLQAFRRLEEHAGDGLPSGKLAERLGVPHNTLSVHLKVLENAGLVSSERRSRSVIYRARPDAIEALARFLVHG